MVVGIVFPLQTEIEFGWLTWASGFIVIVNVFELPIQLELPLLYVGITIIVATNGELVELVAVKLMFPVPVPTKPIDVVSFVQL